MQNRRLLSRDCLYTVDSPLSINRYPSNTLICFQSYVLISRLHTTLSLYIAGVTRAWRVQYWRAANYVIARALARLYNKLHTTYRNKQRKTYMVVLVRVTENNVYSVLFFSKRSSWWMSFVSCLFDNVFKLMATYAYVCTVWFKQRK